MFSENSPLTHRYISFDVVSLFTKVPIDLFLEIVSTHFTEEIFKVPIGAFINLMKFCLTNKFFVFGDRYFKQILIFKFQLVPSILTPKSFWARSVDDIFVLIPNDLDHNDFLISLNMLSGSIEFTVEIEPEQKLPFLDILVNGLNSISEAHK